MFFAAKLGHFTISDFFSTCNKTLKLNSENRKTKKKSFIGSAKAPQTGVLTGRKFYINKI